MPDGNWSCNVFPDGANSTYSVVIINVGVSTQPIVRYWFGRFLIISKRGKILAHNKKVDVESVSMQRKYVGYINRLFSILVTVYGRCQQCVISV